MKKLSSLLLSAVFLFGLASSVFAAPVYETEPNDTKADADYVQIGSTIYGTTSGSSDNDTFSFVATTTGQVEVTYSIISGSKGNIVTIQDANNIIGSVNSTGKGTANVQAGVTYWVKVSPLLNSTPTSYVITLNNL